MRKCNVCGKAAKVLHPIRYSWGGKVLAKSSFCDECNNRRMGKMGRLEYTFVSCLFVVAGLALMLGVYKIIWS